MFALARRRGRRGRERHVAGRRHRGRHRRRASRSAPSTAPITTVGRVNAFIATLASAIILRGLALAITGGFVIALDDESFSDLGRESAVGQALGLPAGRWSRCAEHAAAALHASSAGSSTRSAATRRPRGSRACACTSTRAITFAISGGLAAASPACSWPAAPRPGQAGSGDGIEFTAIAAVVIGGNSIFGGEGAIWRTLVGVFLLALIGNGFNLLSVDPIYQQIVQGGIILLAVAIDAWTRRRS